MARGVEKNRRMELRRQLGNRRFGRELPREKPGGPSYLVAHACFSCRQAFKTNPRADEECTCPTCGGRAHEMGRSFKTPAKSDVDQWRKVQRLFALGFRFFSYRSFDCVPLPERLGDVDAFVDEHPDHPMRVREIRYDLMSGSRLLDVRLMESSREDAASFLRTLRDAIYGIAAADYPADVIEGWAPELTEQNVQRIIENPEREIRVIAELDGRVAGIGSIVPDQNELRACYVVPGAARRGVGSAIVQRLETIGRKHGVRQLELHATVTAAPFYRHLGYTAERRITHTTSTGVEMEALHMIKVLRASDSVSNR